MRRLVGRKVLICLLVIGGAIAYVLVYSPPGQNHPGANGRQGINSSGSQLDQADKAALAAEPPRLPETSPPPGLPINAWGPRDTFHTIRKPWYVSSRQGDSLLAADEPVLGLVIGTEVRAYSTNQLNEHEMVLDEIAGTPVLVTY